MEPGLGGYWLIIGNFVLWSQGRVRGIPRLEPWSIVLWKRGIAAVREELTRKNRALWRKDERELTWGGAVNAQVRLGWSQGCILDNRVQRDTAEYKLSTGQCIYNMRPAHEANTYSYTVIRAFLAWHHSKFSDEKMLVDPGKEQTHSTCCLLSWGMRRH